MHLARVVGAEVDALVIVLEEQLAAVVVVRVLDVDERVARVRELEEELLLDLLELARLDLVALVAVRPREAEQLVVAAEVGREELVDERDVVVERAHLEDLLLAEAEPQVPVLLRVEVVAVLPLLAELPLVPALLDVAIELDAELVRVEPPAARREHAGVVVGVVDDLRRIEDLRRS